MRNSEDNTRLVNEIGNFLNALDWRSDRGGHDEHGDSGFNSDGLADFFEKIKKEVGEK